MKRAVFTFILSVLCFSFANSQTKAKFNYAAQRKFIPAELGRIYLGMPFDELAKQIDLKNAEKALADYKKALELNPKHHVAYFNLRKKIQKRPPR